MCHLTEQLGLISSRSLVADHTGISFLGKTGFSELCIHTEKGCGIFDQRLMVNENCGNLAVFIC